MNRNILILAFAAAAFLPPDAPAQGWMGGAGAGAAQSSSSSSTNVFARVRHQRSWWHFWRAARKTPAEQLAFADSLRESGSIRRACRQYRALVYTWPEAPEAPAAQFAYAELLELRGRLDNAFDEYQFMAETYPGYFSYLPVIERQYAIADRTATQRHRFLFFTWYELEKAVPMFEKIARSAPQWERAAEALFRAGELRQRTGEYLLAAALYNSVQQRYPASPFAEKACFEKSQCYYALSRRYPNSSDIQSLAAALTGEFLVRYPAGADADKARAILGDLRQAQAWLTYRQGRVYEWSLDRPAAAVIMYEKLLAEHPDSTWAQRASANIQKLKPTVETEP